MIDYLILTLFAYLGILWSFYFYQQLDLGGVINQSKKRNTHVFIPLVIIWFIFSAAIYFYLPGLALNLYLGFIFLIFLSIPLFLFLEGNLTVLSL